MKEPTLAKHKKREKSHAVIEAAKKQYRRSIIKRTFVYSLMMSAIAAGVTLSLAWAMGYRFDFRSREVSQVALLQTSSFPAGASVTVNGTALPRQTPTRANIAAGDITVTMSQNGYRSWSKKTTIAQGAVLWLDYARLVPTSIKTSPMRDFPGFVDNLPSPNRKWMVLQQSKDLAFTGETNTAVTSDRTLDLVDLSDPNTVAFDKLTLDVTQLTAPSSGQTESFSLLEWDPGSRYLLVRHDVDDRSEVIELDRQNLTMTRNLTTTFTTTINNPHFADNSGQKVYGITTDNGVKNLRLFNLENDSVSAPLVGNVQEYRMTKDNDVVFTSIFTVSQEDKKVERQAVGLYDGSVRYFAVLADGNESVLADFGRYNGDDFLAIGREKTVTLVANPSVISDVSAVDMTNEDVVFGGANAQYTQLDNSHVMPTDEFATVSGDKPAARAVLTDGRPLVIPLGGNATWLTFNPNERIVLAGDGTNIVSYDTETAWLYRFGLFDVANEPRFLDEYHLLSQDLSGYVMMTDFDGTNSQQLVAGQGVSMLSTDGRRLFHFAKTKTGVALQRSAMTTQ
jgi:hypothetical protein